LKKIVIFLGEYGFVINSLDYLILQSYESFLFFTVKKWHIDVGQADEATGDVI
jgi:hypothetical protein